MEEMENTVCKKSRLHVFIDPSQICLGSDLGVPIIDLFLHACVGENWMLNTMLVSHRESQGSSHYTDSDSVGF